MIEHKIRKATEMKWCSTRPFAPACQTLRSRAPRMHRIQRMFLHHTVDLLSPLLSVYPAMIQRYNDTNLIAFSTAAHTQSTIMGNGTNS